MENKHFAVIGSPIEHSKSPLIHSAAYAYLGLPWDYTRVDVDTGHLAEFIGSTRLDGLSITMPLKEFAYALLGSKHAPAIESKTANTAIRTSEGWNTFNTDVFGLQMALQGAPSDNVLILGNGATARNALLALKQLKPNAKITLRGRDVAKVELAREFALSLDLEVSNTAETIDLALYSLVISTLPPKVDVDSWLTGSTSGTLFDVAYNPWPSALAERWLAGGGNVISGIEMLIWQAIAQIRIFLNGNDADPLINENEIAMVMRNAAVAEG